ncbi:hypothetical protein PMI07_006357 [Rhizobium sp. CF080]|nr:hypothetical protein PMI07_006357 [Rhizobium sp. CF080]
MPGLAVDPTENYKIEILGLRRSSSCGTIVCDCCRERKYAAEFDEDSFGICIDCLACDALLVELKAGEGGTH